jgi:hypothetical protein
MLFRKKQWQKTLLKKKGDQKMLFRKKVWSKTCFFLKSNGNGKKPLNTL